MRLGDISRSDFEILAPVGSYASLHAAIKAGADAIYFGVQGLNMRSRSSANFTLDDLRDIVSTCRSACVKTYLTLNTIIYDNELSQVEEILTAAADSGIDAIIASDISVIEAARHHGLAVHISTQLNISNTRALRFYSQCADVVVLSRELSLEQVSAIHQHIIDEHISGPAGNPVRIEMFCHGALCMAVSGKCYLSLHEMNSSANRGACTQICRRSYLLTDRETGDEITVDNQYLLSPKDLKTIHFIDRMVDAGVRVFKIEGRARSAEYVATTVRCYDRALRALCDGTFTPQLVEECDNELSKVFNRGFWNGYYLGQRLGEWSSKYGSSATRVKRYIGRVTRYYPRISVAEIQLEDGSLDLDDEILILGDNTGCLEQTVGEMRIGDSTDYARHADKGDLIALRVNERVRPGDRLYIWQHVSA